MKKVLDSYTEKGLLYSQVHPTLPLTIYNYTDKCSWENLWDDITLSARGLVVDDLGSVVARPFKKFFNLSEGKTNVTSSYTIFEKLDGSLGILFFYGGVWVFTSRGSFTSEQAIKGKELLDKICNYDLLHKNNTYCFEIIYPENRIVVNYEGFEGVILTGVFDTKTGEEKSLYEWDLPTALKFDSELPLNELHFSINDNEEGYVILFDNGERCKIKGSEYLRLHKMMSEMSTTAVWECLMKGDDISSILSDVPDEFFDLVNEYQVELLYKFKELNDDVWDKYLKINVELGSVSNKEFALHIKDHPYKALFFSLRNGKLIEEQLWKLIKPKYRRL